jgi:hypothetical protein
MTIPTSRVLYRFPISEGRMMTVRPPRQFLEVAESQAYVLGLSFNSKVTSFTMQETSDFLFINDHSMSFVGNGQMKLLKSLMSPRLGDDWVFLRSGSFWLAAGMTESIRYNRCYCRRHDRIPRFRTDKQPVCGCCRPNAARCAGSRCGRCLCRDFVVCIRGHKLRAYRTRAQTRLWRVWGIAAVVVCAFTSVLRAQDTGGESPCIDTKGCFKASDYGRLGRQAADHL